MENIIENKTWKFPKTFWIANTVELFERTAHYALFIAITLYLTNVVGFNDIYAAWISGIYSAGLYLLPTFAGAIADRIGFRKSIILAFALLAIGYFSLGLLPYKAIVIPTLFILMIGGSFIKSIITGTVAKSTSTQNRARAYSIFYGIVNIGSFTGKTVAYPLRIDLGVEYISFYSALMTFIALIIVFFFYKNMETERINKSLKEILQSFVKVMTNFRLLTLILIITGFWIIQNQLYATMPKYVLRTVGAHASPEWISNVNPFIVVISVVLITQLMKKVKAITSIMIGLLIMPISALTMSLSPVLQNMFGTEIHLIFSITAHPITVMLILGVMLQGLAECFISPRYLEYFSLQAPRGEEGLYLGFSHLTSFFSSILGFGISGYLLTTYCPDPKTLAPEQLSTAYLNAHYIWYYFSLIGLLAFIALYIYSKVVNKIDKKRQII